ncbi:unnamed protein product [Camellia sinensis]
MILDKMGLKSGKTKVFLRAGQMAEVDATAEVLGNAANKIQRQIHTYIARKEFISIRKAAIQLQSCWRVLHVLGLVTGNSVPANYIRSLVGKAGGVKWKAISKSVAKPTKKKADMRKQWKSLTANSMSS